MTPLKILVPIDFSPFSSFATDFAAFLAQKYRAKITLYHVVVMYETEFEEEDHLKKIEELVKHKVLTTNTRLAEHREKIDIKDFEVDSDIGHNVSAANSILDYINTHHFDLIIIGTHGRTGIKNWIYGSVAEKVVRMSPIPVITIHSMPRVLQIKNILVPVDFSKNSIAGIDEARKIAKTFDAQINYVHIIEQQLHPSFHVVGIESVFTLNPDLKNISLQKLKEFCFNEDEVATFNVLEGTAHRDIANCAKDTNSDLIVMSTHGYTGLDHALIGSTTERVIRIAPCPVLSVGRHVKK
jgi:nucleotide-binding universal stress UspA family protein